MLGQMARTEDALVVASIVLFASNPYGFFVDDQVIQYIRNSVYEIRIIL